MELTAKPQTPKYLAAQQTIREAIRQGRFPPGSRLPSEQALARNMGMSYMTLRRAVSELTVEGIIERRHGVGIFVCTPTLGSSIAFLVFHVTSVDLAPLATTELEILRQAAGSEGRTVRPLMLLEPLPPATQIIKELRGMDIGAVGLLGFLNTDAEFVRTIADHFPCALFNKRLPSVNLPYAAPDTLEAARLCVEYFAVRGRTRVGLALPNVHHSLHAEFSFALESELLRQGLPVDRRCWFEGESYGEERLLVRWVEAVLNRPDAPDALVLPNHDAADCAAEALARNSRVLGRDADIISFYSGSRERAIERHRKPYPQLLWNYDQAARTVSEMLLAMAKNGKDAVGSPVARVRPELLLPNTPSMKAG